jgi:hypothetical protein
LAPIVALEALLVRSNQLGRHTAGVVVHELADSVFAEGV